MNTSINQNGGIIASLINIENAIENEITERIKCNSINFFDAKNFTKKSNEEGDILFCWSDIKLPEIITSNLFGWLMIVSSKSPSGESNYIAAINLSNKTTGSIFLSYEVQIPKEMWEKVNKLILSQ